MREASNEVLEKYVDYCQALLAAETEEDILAAKDQMAQDLIEQGHTEEEVHTFLGTMDELVEKIEDGEYVFNGTTFVLKDKEESYGTLYEGPTTEANSASMAYTKAGIGLGLAGATIVTVLALKKKVFKNKKNKNL